MASRGLSRVGSGTVSTRTSSFPFQQSARMVGTSSEWVLDVDGTALAVRLPFNGGDLSGFHQRLEAAQVLRDLQLRHLTRRAEHTAEPPDAADLDPDAHRGTAAGGGFLEEDRSRLLDLRVR